MQHIICFYEIKTKNSISNTVLTQNSVTQNSDTNSYSGPFLLSQEWQFLVFFTGNYFKSDHFFLVFFANDFYFARFSLNFKVLYAVNLIHFILKFTILLIFFLMIRALIILVIIDERMYYVKCSISRDENHDSCATRRPKFINISPFLQNNHDN